MNVFSFVLALALGAAPQGGEHPVPLPADFDAAKCAECHVDKQQGKHVHSAVSMGCTTCHTVEAEGETTRVKLNAGPDELCVTCHEQKKDAVLHGPYARGQCLLCHDAHVSDFAAHTRSGGNNLCLACHAERPQGADTPAVQVFDSHTIPAEEFAQIPKIVLDRARRRGHPFLDHPVAGRPDPLRKGEDLGCLSCHQPHGAVLGKLLLESWKGAQVCDDCHQAAKAARNKP